MPRRNKKISPVSVLFRIIALSTGPYSITAPNLASNLFALSRLSVHPCVSGRLASCRTLNLPN